MESEERIKNDPIEFPHRYSHPVDIEVTGFIASSLAYGRIDLFKPVLNELFSRMGNSPADFCSTYLPRRDRKKLHGIRYRFNSEEDFSDLISLTGRVLKKYGSLASLFYSFYRDDSEDIREGLTGFVEHFRSRIKCTGKKRQKWGGGMYHFLPTPRNGGACKRMNLFLRWMVRRKGIDFGIWDRIPPSKLIIPLDTHISRIGYRLGFTRKKGVNWSTAHDITVKLREFDPLDPVKYDFALCHFGVTGQCPVQLDVDSCERCRFKGECRVLELG